MIEDKPSLVLGFVIFTVTVNHLKAPIINRASNMAKDKVKKRKSASQDGFIIAEGLNGIRLNPTMYLGNLGHDMAYRVIKEEVDNAYDEAVAGRNKLIEVILDYDADFHIVADAAGGIPTDYKKLEDGSKETIMTAAFTRAHAGGKFNSDAYKTSAGTHGVGVAAVNAVCESLRVWSMYKGKCAFQSYSKGKITTEGKDPVKVKGVDKDVASRLSMKAAKYGTIIAGQLDQTVVSESARRGKALPKDYVHARPQAKAVAHWLKNMANLNPGLEIRFSVIKGKQRKDFKFINKKDLAWVPKAMCDERELNTIGKPLTFKSDNISCTVVWADHPDSDNFLTFVNTSPTVDGGWHVTGFTAALMAAIKPYLPAPKKTKKGSSNGFSSSDLLIGLVGMFDWRMHGAMYTSQVKDKLASKVDKEVQTVMFPVFEKYFEQNKKVATTIIKRAQAMNKGREELAAVVKSMADVKKGAKGASLPSVLAMADKAKPEHRELFLVEGDSAAGTAINARNSDYQEVLGAGGKPLNALKAALAKVLGHEEVQNMLIAMGADIKTLDPKAEAPVISTDNLRTANLIFLVDPDPDGGHIAVLFLAAIYRLMPNLFREGRVWCVFAPLYACLHDGKLYGGMTFQECRAAAPKAVKDKDITRIKGWGEVDETYLEPIAFNPKTRKLIRINPFQDHEQELWFRGVVAEDAVYRRRLLGLED